jgi:hypothetical protein
MARAPDSMDSGNAAERATRAFSLETKSRSPSTMVRSMRRTLPLVRCRRQYRGTDPLDPLPLPRDKRSADPLLLAGLPSLAQGSVFLDLGLGHVLVLCADHTEDRRRYARATGHWAELLGTALDRGRNGRSHSA